MSYFKPDKYYKSILDINYQKLKEEGITCLLFDLDNTLGLISQKTCPDLTKQLIRTLKKDFTIIISSNNTKKRLQPYLEELQIDGVAWSLKPSIRAFKVIEKKYGISKNNMCIIGDQIVTDIFAGKRYKVKTILVDPLGKKDLKITSLNRFIENFIVKRYKKKGIFERGFYYE